MAVDNFTIEVGGWVPETESIKDTLKSADWDIIKDIIKDRLNGGVYSTKDHAKGAEDPDTPLVYRKFYVVVALDVQDFKTRQDSKAV